MKHHIETFHPDGKADLATAFVERCLRFCTKGGTVALVTPQNWLFLGSYKSLRERLLKSTKWNVVIKLGMAAFTDMYWWAFNTGLFILTNSLPDTADNLIGLDTDETRVPAEKANLLRLAPVQNVSQPTQLQNPDARIILDEHSGGTLLEKYAIGLQGVSPADFPHYGRCFWEVDPSNKDWHFWQSSVEETAHYGGRERVLWMNEDFFEAVQVGSAYIRGQRAWGKTGVVVSAMRHLPCTLYTGHPFDTNVAIILPKDPSHVPAIWYFCSSPEYHTAVRRIDQKLNVTNATLVKVPFDLEHWQKVAEEKYPNGLPEPHSDDPTQWLFKGNPVTAHHPSLPAATLQVGMARLLEYRWPQNNTDDLNRLVDEDGIVCLPPVAGEPPATQRLRELLAAAYGSDWTPGVEERLVSEAGYGGQSLDTWLQEGFFAQHCRMFHNRPFLWHIWDGRKDGFSAIVNYHKLDRAKLDRLIYTYLGDWINSQRHANRQGVPGANARLVAALNLQEKLKAIADGEPPFDIYVRWKPLHQQPIGWEPDLNDGVRLNIRPFVNAGVLRSKFSINWNKDRGTNPDGTERLNVLERPYTRAQKEAARRQQEAL